MSKADRLKHSRELDLAARGRERGNSGEWPKRYRGYYRALKRKEEWAIKLSQKSTLGFLLSWTYRPDLIRAICLSENPFLSIVLKPKKP